MLLFENIACARNEKEEKKIYIVIYRNIIVYYRRYNYDILFETGSWKKKMFKSFRSHRIINSHAIESRSLIINTFFIFKLFNIFKTYRLRKLKIVIIIIFDKEFY